MRPCYPPTEMGRGWQMTWPMMPHSVQDGRRDSRPWDYRKSEEHRGRKRANWSNWGKKAQLLSSWPCCRIPWILLEEYHSRIIQNNTAVIQNTDPIMAKHQQTQESRHKFTYIHTHTRADTHTVHAGTKKMVQLIKSLSCKQKDLDWITHLKPH